MNHPDYPQNPYQQPLPTSTMAVVSLVAGILGFTAFPVLGSIAAIITGYAARNETRANPPTASGDGMATTGIVLGWVSIGLAVIGLCCVAAYFIFVIGLVAVGGQ
jgi:apolipoprotein N-acyltransferase